jgi:class 3 adenylate cyclase/tetratricopeptide (TPR) repeat protein/DNA-binding XRE family transcriptional regulator
MAEARAPAAFGDLVRQYRLAGGLTQAVLAERAGISLRAVQDLERSVGQPQRETSRRLAEAFALTAEQRAEFDRAAAPAPRSHTTARPPSLRSADGTDEPAGPLQRASSDPGGEKKRVTVLVAEVAGLTDSAHDFEPDLADRLQTSIVPLLLEAIHQCNGMVNRVGGDGIMAIFGVPQAHEDDAVRACHAALALHAAFERFIRQSDAVSAHRLALCVGLSSSDIVLRSISSHQPQEYTALGPAVRAATRLAQVAAGGTTLLSAETVRAAEGYIQVRHVGGEGSGDPSSAGVEAFALVGIPRAQTRFQRVVTTRQLTPFTGRDTELAALGLALRQAGAGRGQIVALVGEPGVGKSRLIWEMTRSAWSDGWLVLECGAVAQDTASSYGPAIDLLRAYCRIEPRDDGPTIREKVTGRLLALDRGLGPDLPALLALLDAPVDDAAWDALDPPRRRDRTLAALKRLLLRQSQEAPLLLVFEDLHWIDGETQALLDSLVESLPAARLLVLVSYRPEYAHQWARKTYYSQLHVGALQGQPADDLLVALLGDDAALHTLRQQLVRQADGNPLFLEECVRDLIDAGSLSGERGAYRQEGPIDAIRVPDTVQTVLGARIDRLDPETKRLLQLAAVIGKDVPFALLRAITDAPDAEVHDLLSRILATELMYEAHLLPELVYTFKHALTHEVAYGGLLQDRRRGLHARIVEALEAAASDDGRGQDQLAEQIDRLGHHALRGELWEQAVTYLRRAGLRDGARSANRAAATSFEQALDALNHLPDRPDTRQLAVDIRLDLRNVLLPLNEIGAMFDHLLQAERHAISLDDRYRLGWVSAYLTACYCNDSQPAEAETAGLRAMTIAEECADLPLQVMAHFFLGLAYVCACRWRESVALLSWNSGRLTGALAFERFGEPGLTAVFSRSYLLRALAEIGQFDEALTQGEEAIRLSESTDLAMCLASTLEGLGFVHLWRGDLPEAIAILERSLRLCEERQFLLILYPVQAYLGYAYALAGRDAEAMPLLEASARVDRGLHPALRTTMLGEAHLLAGRLDLAQQCVDRALALAAAGEEHGSRAWTLRLAAEVALAHGSEHADEAAVQYQAAQALAAEHGMRPLRALCHLSLGRLYRRPGHLEDARAELSAAILMTREMGMARWLSEAEDELAQPSTTVTN